MRPDASLQRHRVTHQATDSTIAVWKRMDVIQSMMRGGQCQDALRSAEAIKTITLCKIIHEGCDGGAVRWRVATDRDVMHRRITECARLHLEVATRARDLQHFYECVAIEIAV